MRINPTRDYKPSGRFVPGRGPKPCSLMFVGKAPGKDEDRTGQCWVGNDGQELWRYIWRELHLTEEDVYVTNLVKHYVPQDKDPTPADIARDKHILVEELRTVAPRFVCTLGSWASRYFLGRVDMGVVNGVPHTRNHRVVVPVVHPAAGLHSTEFQALTWYGMKQLGRVMRGEISEQEPIDEHPQPLYELMDFSTSEVRSDVSVDTEGNKENPWCLSLSQMSGMGWVSKPPVQVGKISGQVTLHNSMWDLGVLRAMGIELDDDQFHDTMVMAYELGIEPQGLKELALRHLGMKMSSYKEVIGEAGMMLEVDYLRRVGEWLNRHYPSGSTKSSPMLNQARRLISGNVGTKSARTFHKR